MQHHDVLRSERARELAYARGDGRLRPKLDRERGHLSRRAAGHGLGVAEVEHRPGILVGEARVVDAPDGERASAELERRAWSNVQLAREYVADEHAPGGHLMPGRDHQLACRETGPLDSLMEMQSKLVWRLLSENDKAYGPTLADFSKGQRALRSAWSFRSRQNDPIETSVVLAPVGIDEFEIPAAHIRGGADVTGLEAMSGNRATLDHPFHRFGGRVRERLPG